MATAALRDKELGSRGGGAQLPFDSINEPGCYVCNWSGHLLRVPEDAVKEGRSPLMTLTGRESLFVTRISNDPFVPRSKARLLASDYDLSVSF